MRRKIDILILIAVLIAGGFAVKNAQNIGDWWYFLRYEPSREIVKLADDAGMSETGRRLFYRFDPQLVDQKTLDSVCDVEKLGCVTGRTIYILNAQDKASQATAVVTAAHEMLHVVYARSSKKQLERINPKLKAELKKPGNSGIVTTIAEYPADEQLNEAHSFMGTEVTALDSTLETHYKKYFSDRDKVTEAYFSSRQ